MPRFATLVRKRTAGDVRAFRLISAGVAERRPPSARIWTKVPSQFDLPTLIIVHLEPVVFGFLLSRRGWFPSGLQYPHHSQNKTKTRAVMGSRAAPHGEPLLPACPGASLRKQPGAVDCPRSRRETSPPRPAGGGPNARGSAR